MQLVFEDDGRVAYAYLFSEGEIVGDVWLYNSGETPDNPDWEDFSEMPFLNGREFSKGERYPRIHEVSEVRVQWADDHDGTAGRAELYLREKLFAILEPGAKPGWSRWALKDGPLAKAFPAEL